MTLRTSLTGLAATLSLVGFAGAANAQQQVNFASITSFNNAQVFTYQENGAFTITTTQASSFFGAQTFGPGSPSFNVPVTVTFTGMGDSGDLIAPTSPGGKYTQALTAGTFSVVDALNNNLLSGVFSGSTLSGQVGDQSGAVDANFLNVFYTGGTYFTNSGLQSPGNFSIALLTINAAQTPSGLQLNAGATAFQSFTASGTGVFSATGMVPEPGEWAAMGMAGMSVMGLMVRARRKASRNSVASA